MAGCSSASAMFRTPEWAADPNYATEAMRVTTVRRSPCIEPITCRSGALK
jgi:hypothetical protein